MHFQREPLQGQRHGGDTRTDARLGSDKIDDVTQRAKGFLRLPVEKHTKLLLDIEEELKNGKGVQHGHPQIPNQFVVRMNPGYIHGKVTPQNIPHFHRNPRLFRGEKPAPKLVRRQCFTPPHKPYDPLPLERLNDSGNSFHSDMNVSPVNDPDFSKFGKYFRFFGFMIV